MKRYFYFASAVLLSMAASSLKAQTIITEDTEIVAPYEEADFYEGSEHVIIGGATVTITHEALNTCGLPFGSGSSITLADGAKLVFFNSPDYWYPDIDNPSNEDYIYYMFDDNANVVTSFPFNFVIEECATIVLDSKCSF